MLMRCYTRHGMVWESYRAVSVVLGDPQNLPDYGQAGVDAAGSCGEPAWLTPVRQGFSGKSRAALASEKFPNRFVTGISSERMSAFRWWHLP